MSTPNGPRTVTTPAHHTGPGRAPRTFWALTLVAVAATGSLSAALTAPTGAVTGLRVAVSGLVLIVAGALAARVLIVVDRARHRSAAGRQDLAGPAPIVVSELRRKRE